MSASDDPEMTGGDFVELLLIVLGNPALERMDVRAEGSGAPQYCYGNARNLILEQREWKLVLGRMMPYQISHAWVWTPDGCFDPTLGELRVEGQWYEGHVVDDMRAMDAACKRWRRCEQTTKKGQQCKRNAMFPSSYCGRHGGTWTYWPPEPPTQ